MSGGPDLRLDGSVGRHGSPRASAGAGRASGRQDGYLPALPVRRVRRALLSHAGGPVLAHLPHGRYPTPSGHSGHVRRQQLPGHAQVSGQLTGPVSGQQTGPVSGQVTGPVSGQQTGQVSGQQTGPVSGQQTGQVSGQQR